MTGEIWDFGRGLMVHVTSEEEYELKNAEGEPIVEGKWSCVQQAADGIVLAVRDGRAYYFDFTGRLIQEGEWMLAGCFSEGLAVCGGKDGLRYFDTSGRVVLRLDPRWREAQGFHEGLAAVAEGNFWEHRWGYIDRKGELVIEPKWEMAGDFSGGTAIVARGRRYAVIDRSGRELSLADLEAIRREGDSLE